MKIIYPFLLLAFFGNGKYSRNRAEIEVGEYFDSSDSSVEDSSDSDSDSQVHWDDEEIAVGLASGDVWEEDLEDELSSPLLKLYAAHLTTEDDEEVALSEWNDDLHSSGTHPAQILGERGVGSRKEYLTRWEGSRIPDWQNLDQLEGFDYKKPPALLDWEARKRERRDRQRRVGEEDSYEDEDARYDYDELEQMVGDIEQDIANDGFENRRSLFLRDMLGEAEDTLDIHPEGPTAAKDVQELFEEQVQQDSPKKVKRQEKEAKKVREEGKKMDKKVKKRDAKAERKNTKAERKAEEEAQKERKKAKKLLKDDDDDDDENPTLKKVKKKLKELRDVKDAAKTQSDLVKNAGAKDGIPGIVADLHEHLKRMDLKNDNWKLDALNTKSQLLRKRRSQRRGRMKRLLKKLAKARQEALNEHGDKYSVRGSALDVLKKAHAHLKTILGKEKLMESKKKKKKSEEYSPNLPKTTRMELLGNSKGKELKAILKQMNFNDNLASTIFDVLNRNSQTHGMKRYMRLRKKKADMIDRLNELRSKRRRQEKEKTKRTSKHHEKMMEVVKKLLAAKKEKPEKKKKSRHHDQIMNVMKLLKKKKPKQSTNPMVKTIVIGPEDLENPDAIHQKAQQRIQQHMQMKNVINNAKQWKSHDDHLNDLRQFFPFIDDFFGDIEGMAPGSGSGPGPDSSSSSSSRSDSSSSSDSSGPAADKKDDDDGEDDDDAETTEKPKTPEEEKEEEEAKKEIEKRDEMKKKAIQKAEDKAKEDGDEGPFFKGRKGVISAAGFTVKLPRNKAGLKKERYSRFSMPTPKTRACVSSCCPCGFRRVRWSYKDGCYNVEGTCARCSAPAEKKLKAVGFSYVYNPSVSKTLPLFTFRRTGKEWKKNPHYKSKCPSGKVLTGLGTIVTQYEQKLKHSMRIKCASGTDPRLPKESMTFESEP